MIPVGIDDLNVDGGTLKLLATELAAGRGTRPEDHARLQLIERGVLPPFEDPVTLAVNAAWPLLQSTDRSRVRLLLVATESGVDFAKPLTSYVHEHLKLPANCRHMEVKHACYAGTMALRLASTWLRENPKAQALVICTDMARKLFLDPAEAAEGVGATAMLLSAEPRVMVLEPRAGVATREIYDVMRPTPTLETIHASLSLAGYLDLLEGAWADYRAQPGARDLTDFERLLFHTPLIPLVKQGHGLLRELADPDGDRSEDADDFASRVFPSFKFCQQTGNTYSGSLYVALAAAAEEAAGISKPRRLFLYSYGSGSCAELFEGSLQPGAAAQVKRHGIGARLGARQALKFAQYEQAVLSTEAHMTERHHLAQREQIDGLWESHYAGKHRLTLREVKDYHRGYAWS
jgi:3-hydroxy-3-methylglutaryl CoA synthase